MANKESLVEEVETTVERAYTLRKLKDGDLFPLLQLFRKLGLKDYKDVIMQAADAVDNKTSIKEVGVGVVLQMADKVIENLDGPAGEDIYSFWSGLSNIPVDEIKEMEFGTLPMMIYDSFNEVKNSSFFKVLSKLL